MSPSVIQPPDRWEYCPEEDYRVCDHVSPPPDYSLRDLAGYPAAFQGALNMPILDYWPVSYRQLLQQGPDWPDYWIGTEPGHAGIGEEALEPVDIGKGPEQEHSPGQEAIVQDRGRGVH